MISSIPHTQAVGLGVWRGSCIFVCCVIGGAGIGSSEGSSAGVDWGLGVFAIVGYIRC